MRQPMSLPEAATLRDGDIVDVLVDMTGDNDDYHEVTLRAPVRCRVETVVELGNMQGLGVRVRSLEDGITNLFDEGDFGGTYPFRRVPIEDYMDPPPTAGWKAMCWAAAFLVGLTLYSVQLNWAMRRDVQPLIWLNFALYVVIALASGFYLLRFLRGR